MAAYSSSLLHHSHSLAIDGSGTEPWFQNPDSDSSSGYLEDALLEFTEMSKRRRLLFYSDDGRDLTNGFNHLSKSCLCSENLSCRNQFTSINGVSDEPLSSGEASIVAEINTPEKAIILSSSGNDDKKKRVITRVVYPFALVKPGGIEGDMTLNDINKRLLMPPTKPVRHPVGDFGRQPCISAGGTGLSGKAVAALTKIYTQGRGSVTVIRTKG
ncbi:hypothetical protein like AT2G01990 [Hibiscus trionum]|uniref:Uncharacterized protein n=1 Tax=Hibiscus trionum TaxID=183268 RepID=A0A9W7MKI7_HIBTR|nr:hypothetical protein like AT2G01990 [Hibiscus trionum]